MNMRIAHLSMDAQDKSRFEIQGKSSVKYHLKANHIVEAKRWFWALNNAIQYAKDEAKGEEQQKQRDAEGVRQGRKDHNGSGTANIERPDPLSAFDGSRLGGKGVIPAIAIGNASSNASRLSFKNSTLEASSVVDDDQVSAYGSYAQSTGANELHSVMDRTNAAATPGDLDDDDEYGDDVSSREVKPTPKDAFNITAHSANLQLDLLGQVSKALQERVSTQPDTPIADPTITQAIITYEGAVQSLQSMVADLLKIARDRDAYWQYRVDREADMRRLWEDSMAKVAIEQEQLQDRIGESEEKRKRTKRALRDALEGVPEAASRPDSQGIRDSTDQIPSDFADSSLGHDTKYMPRRKSVGVRDMRRKSTIAAFTDLSDSDSDADEEFFDAVGAGEVEVVDTMPLSPSREPSVATLPPTSKLDDLEGKASELEKSFKGYEEPVRKKLKMDADDRPKISLWVS